MFEVTTEALVIDKEPAGEKDSRVFLYSEELGGVVARGTGMRKITSKLAAAFEPLRFVKVRLIQRRGDYGFQIGDAVMLHRSEAWRENVESLRAGLKLAGLFKEAGFRGDKDAALWEEIVDIFTNPPDAPLPTYGARLLSAIGFNPAGAKCASCGSGNPNLFYVKELVFICRACAQRINFV
jgi:DNA repair protein RecO